MTTFNLAAAPRSLNGLTPEMNDLIWFIRDEQAKIKYLRSAEHLMTYFNALKADARAGLVAPVLFFMFKQAWVNAFNDTVNDLVERSAWDKGTGLDEVTLNRIVKSQFHMTFKGDFALRLLKNAPDSKLKADLQVMSDFFATVVDPGTF